MASTDLIVCDVYQNPHHVASVEISAVLRLTCAAEAFLILSFPERTAAALATRMLAGVPAKIDEQLIQDCVGEIGNVVAGQAKTLLAGTPYDFAFSLPNVLVGVNTPPAPGLDCLVVDFDGDLGEFALRLFLKL
jgi:chemotaxis protein CheX